MNHPNPSATATTNAISVRSFICAHFICLHLRAANTGCAIARRQDQLARVNITRRFDPGPCRNLRNANWFELVRGTPYSIIDRGVTARQAAVRNVTLNY